MTIKISFKIGGRVQLKNRDVLPVTLAVSDAQGQIEEIVSFLSPLPQTLEIAFTDWQNCVRLLGNRKVMKDRNNRSLGKVTLTDLTNTLKAELNQWLGSDNWIDGNGNSDYRVIQVLENYRKNLNKKNEIRIIVQTEDPQLRGLPWQEWESLEKYSSQGVEVALSATNFRRLTQRQRSQIKATVRILVVFGDDRLDFRKENEFIQRLKRYGAEPDTLYQPSPQTLKAKLKDPQGWHIFFFAGHSGSDRKLQNGWLQLKPAIINEKGETIQKEEVIGIDDLTELLKISIQDKLQLAIFNSCDGLGLANHLTDLSLPYCIVMREEVASDVATELLKHFLEAFVKDYSLFTSMNKARNQLKRKFELGQSWLPVIVANPLAKELTWNSLFSERRLSWQWEIVLGAIAIFTLICLPLGIFFEFEGWESLTFYAQLYPHITVYPSLLLWIPLFASYKAHCMIRVKTLPFVISTLVTVFIVSGALFLELNSDRMMFMEFKSEATSVIPKTQLQQQFLRWKTSEEDIYAIPQRIFDTRQAFDVNGDLTLKKSELETATKKFVVYNDPANNTGFQALLRIATSIDVWRQNTEAFSITRWLYALNFIAILGCGMQILTLVFTILIAPDSIFNKNRYLMYLIMCELGIVLWIPFQNYTSNSKFKTATNNT